MHHKAIFFDRDGVINIDYGYVHSVDRFEFYGDFFACADKFKQDGYKLIVITNQSGIQRGYYSIIDFLRLSKFMQDGIFGRLGFRLDRIYFCPFLESTRRKPAPGMIVQARDDFGLKLERCILIGDNLSDMEAGKNAGVGRLFLIDRGDKNRYGVKNQYFSIIKSLREILESGEIYV